MAKTELTKTIELLLFHESRADKVGIYGAFEVAFGPGYGTEYVDYMTMTSSGEITCYEIKVSKADFHSKAKLSFYGDKNYFVMPKVLYEDVKNEIPFSVGVYVYDNGTLSLIKKSSKKTVPPWDRYMVAHCMVRSLSQLTTKLVKEREQKQNEKSQGVE